MNRRLKTILPIIVVGLGALGFLPDEAVNMLNQVLQQQSQGNVSEPAAQNETKKPAPKAAQKPAKAEAHQNANFDFYVLALSWSPTYCADADKSRAREQCGAGKKYGFVVHGLWPQFEKGYPEYCGTQQVDRISKDAEEGMRDIMPSRGLMRHQWVKHGTCTGLSPGGYFGKTRAAYKSISIPSTLRAIPQSRTIDARQVENEFISANPSLAANGISVQCIKGRVKEVRICLSKDLKPLACPDVDRRGCMQNDLDMPAPR